MSNVNRFGNGIFYQSLGQGLAAAASMYATLSMQGKALKAEQTDADARKIEAENNRLKLQKGETSDSNVKAIQEVEDEEADRLDLSSYGKVVGQSSQNNFQFEPSQSLVGNQSLDDGKSAGYIDKALKRSQSKDFAMNSSTGGIF